jgi:hypothetical protein
MVAGVLIAGTTGAAAAGGTITVTPTTGLVTGQTVTISGSGWAPGATVGWCEGITAVPPELPSTQLCNTNGVVTTTTDASGDFSGQLKVVRFIYIAGRNQNRFDCADPGESCAIGVADQSDIPGTVATVAVHFATVPRTIFPGTGSVAEGNTGTTALKVAVRLSKAQSLPVTVRWATEYVLGAPGSQATPPFAPSSDRDYTPASGTVTFAAGQILKTVSISVNGDTIVEQNQYIVVQFSHPVNAVMGGFYGLGFGVIKNDD